MESSVTTLELFLPLAKVDLDQRLVTGVATAEIPDRSGEICDYASSKPYFEKWSAEALAASGGKSMGAVRAMHGAVAAGKLTDIAFDDERKRVVVAAKIVDDDEWRKVTEGVYTGFSQGGRYVKRWPDEETGLIRYTAEPHEISLVDLPCLPDATFDVVKDGMIEKRAFAAQSRGRRPVGDGRVGRRRADRPSDNAADIGCVLQGCKRTGGRCNQTRSRPKTGLAPAEGARNSVSFARRSYDARRRARGPATSRQGGAESGGEKRRWRG